MLKIWLLLVTVLFSLTRSQFIGPSQRYPFAEAFQYNEEYEFVISNLSLEWIHANAVCQFAYRGWLATLETVKLKQFTVEAMSESNMALDSLWVALKEIHGSFYWLNSNIILVDNKIEKCGNNIIASSNNCQHSYCTNQTKCGALVRANHGIPCFANLNCDALRGFICKRRVDNDNSSTHLGWIKVRHRYYKIFHHTFSYENAMKACISYDTRAKLAVVETYEDAQILGRYLLIGRPSLEKVWIGALWKKGYYGFEPEPIVLSNTSDDSGYPPWLNSTMSKSKGCLLLDRHLGNITLFVESKCNRLQHYMCYKLEEKDTPADVCNVGDYDWRIYYSKLNWFEATEKCMVSARTGRLAVLEEKDLKYFIHIMESSKKYLLHVWLGAYYKYGTWIWTYTNRTLPKEQKDGYPPWVVNKTFNDDVEKYNLCLNIDRENTIVPIFYGTVCKYAQTFICQYDKGVICSNMSTTTFATKTTAVSTMLTTTKPSLNTTRTTTLTATFATKTITVSTMLTTTKTLISTTQATTTSTSTTTKATITPRTTSTAYTTKTSNYATTDEDSPIISESTQYYTTTQLQPIKTIKRGSRNLRYTKTGHSRIKRRKSRAHKFIKSHKTIKPAHTRRTHKRPRTNRRFKVTKTTKPTIIKLTKTTPAKPTRSPVKSNHN